MARRKTEETKYELFAQMKQDGHRKRTVKAWQYYSVYDFVRSCGETRETADEIAKWCRDKSEDGDVKQGDGYEIRIERKAVV